MDEYITLSSSKKSYTTCNFSVTILMTVPSAKIGSFSAPLSLNFDGGGVSARRLELLAAIGQENSINGAAKAVGMTYKGA